MNSRRFAEFQCLFLIFPMPFDQRPIFTIMNCILRAPHHSWLSFDSHLRFVKMIKEKVIIEHRTNAFRMMKPTDTTHFYSFSRETFLGVFVCGMRNVVERANGWRCQRLQNNCNLMYEKGTKTYPLFCRRFFSSLDILQFRPLDKRKEVANRKSKLL